MTSRVPWDPDDYLAVARRACFDHQQANRHVHRHLAPLPPGVPYEDQQTAVFEPARGHHDLPGDQVADLTQRLRELLHAD